MSREKGFGTGVQHDAGVDQLLALLLVHLGDVDSGIFELYILLVPLLLSEDLGPFAFI